jgi:hypothetical protein
MRLSQMQAVPGHSEGGRRMNVELAPKAAKHLKSMNQPDKGRIVRALEQCRKGETVSLSSAV